MYLSRPPTHRRWPALLLVMLGALRAAPAAADLPDFSHTALGLNEGAPADVWTLSLAERDQLWLGSGQGLYRFDGLSFQRYALRPGERLRSTNINALLVRPDGDIWLGLFAGGVVRLRDGRVTQFGSAEGLPAGRVLRLAATPDGAIWAAAAAGLARFERGRWQAVGESMGVPTDGVDYVFTDSRGTLWVASGGGIYWLPPGEGRFQAAPQRVSGVPVLAEDRQGRIWLSDDLGGTRPVAQAGGGWRAPAWAPALPAAPDSRPRAKQMLFARDGSLWLSMYGVGVLRWPQAQSLRFGEVLGAGAGLQRFGTEDGLPSTVLVPLVEDEDGRVWIGTNLGLSSFHPRLLQAVHELDGPLRGAYVLSQQGAGVRVSNQARVLDLDPPQPARPLPDRNPWHLSVNTPAGGRWTLAPGELVHERGATRQRWPLLPAGSWRLLSMAPDSEGRLWLSFAGRGVYRADSQGLQAQPLASCQRGEPTAMAHGPTPPQWLPTARAEAGSATAPTTTAEATWLACDDELVALSGGQRWRFTEHEGLLVGRASALAVGQRALWVAGERGLARWDGRQLLTITDQRDPAFAHITGIVELPNGDLWLNGGRGVLRVRAGAQDSLFDVTQAAPNYRLLDRRDGLPGAALQAHTVPTALRDARGRLWFATNRGIAWLAPERLDGPERPLRATILGLRAGEQELPADSDQRLMPGTRTVTLRYAAQTLANADRARYRYRLEGVDGDWQPAGLRREATYANLGPGHYRFRVQAARDDGRWTGEEAQLAFRIQPRLHESRVFLAACGLIVLLLLWLGYRLRLRALSARMHALLEERHRERERIARELHDTLLQSVQGLVMLFHAAGERIADAGVRQQLDRALTRAQEVIAEGRDRVRLLRAHPEPAQTLTQALHDAATELLPATLPWRFQLLGRPQALKPWIQAELLQLAREALSNITRHAHASEVKLVLAFGTQDLTLTLRDDGVGLDLDRQTAYEQQGHFGLRGMQERAQRMGARLSLGAPLKGPGTELMLRLAAGLAYAHAPPARPWWRRWAGN